MLEELSISLLKLEEIKDIVELEQKHFINPWDYDAYLNEFNNNPCAYIYVLKLKDRIIGYIDYWITFDSATIAKICIDKEYQGRGFSTYLMDKMIKNVKRENVQFVTLEVRKSNESAIGLYKKYGFYVETIKKQYYQNLEDALYMIWEVK